MLEKINEPIEAQVDFRGAKVRPRFFKWRNKIYEIEKVNMVHQERQGNDRVYYFSVTDSVNFFRLAFFTRDLSWRIEELWCE